MLNCRAFLIGALSLVGCGAVSGEGDGLTAGSAESEEVVASSVDALTGCAQFNANRWYKIGTRYSGKYAAVQGTSSVRGAKIDQEPWSPPAQNTFWNITPSGDGYSFIKSKTSGMVWDVKDVSLFNGADIQQWPKTPSENQKFCFEPLSSGLHAVRAKHSGRYVQVNNTTTGSVLQQWDRDINATQQRWGVSLALNSEKLDVNVTYKIISANSRHVADLVGASSQNGVPIDQWYDSGELDQGWRFVATPPIANDQCYAIVSTYTNKPWDAAVTPGGQNAGASVFQNGWTGSDSQKWCFYKQPNGNYIVLNFHAALPLQVRGANLTAGARLELGSEMMTLNQEWILMQQCGYRKFLYNGQCLDRCPEGYVASPHSECVRGT